MDNWQPIETLKFDGELREFRSRNGSCFIAPAVAPAEPSVAEKKMIYKRSGAWPNVGWNPTHWRNLPSDPVAS